MAVVLSVFSRNLFLFYKMNLIFRLFFLLSAALVFASCNSENATSDKLANTSAQVSDGYEALQSASQAIEKDPGNALNFKRRANLYLNRNQFDEALTDIDRALAIDSTKGEFYYLKARALRGRKNVPGALKTAHKAEQKGFSDANLYLAMGEMYLIFKEYQKSIDYLNKSLEKSQFNEQAYFYKGLVYAESQDTARAISSFQTAIEQKPSYTDAYNALIKIYNAQNNRDLASQYLISGLRFAPNDPYLQYNKGVILRARGNADSAMTAFKTALYYDSTMYLAAYNLGTVAYEKENYQVAAPALQKAYNQNNQLPGIEGMLAYSYEQLGNFTKAEEFYIKAADKTPNDKEITDGFKRVKAKTQAQAATNP